MLREALREMLLQERQLQASDLRIAYQLAHTPETPDPIGQQFLMYRER